MPGPRQGGRHLNALGIHRNEDEMKITMPNLPPATP